VDMAANNYFSHDEKSKRSHSDRISLLDRKLVYSVAMENIAFMRGGDITGKAPETLHRGLMESDSHRKAILSDEVTHIAVGAVRHENGVWLTQVFVNKMGEFLTPVPTRIRAAEELRFRVMLPGWKPGGFEAHQKDEQKSLMSVSGGSALRLPKGIHGDFQLMVRGERPNENVKVKKSGTEYLLRATVSGPIMSVAPDSYTLASRDASVPVPVVTRRTVSWAQPTPKPRPNAS